MSYYEEAYKKKEKGQPIYFQPRLWSTLNEKPWIGNKILMNQSLYNSARFIASKEFSEKDDEFENKILEIYNESGGEIEDFNSSNYQVPASIGQIYEVTFKNIQYEIDILVTSIEQEYFSAFGLLIPFLTTKSFTVKSTTRPEFTENYERVTGQRHISNDLTIDTTRILRRNGNYYPKIRVVGSDNFGPVVGTIPFLGGGIPITPLNLNLENSLSITAFGNIRVVTNNKFGERIQNRENWSLKREFKLFENGNIEKEKMSQLALDGLSEVGLE